MDFIQHSNIVWGNKCNCGNNIDILQNQFHPWDTETNFKITIKCSNCGIINTISQKEASNYYNNKIYEIYDEISGNIIDLGCGGGFLSSLAKQKGCHVLGIDIDKKSSDLIGTNLDIFENLDINSLNINSLEKKYITKYNYIIHRDVFMFISNTENYFKQIKNVGKGVIHVGWFVKNNKRMKNLLTPDQILQKYLEAGFKASIEYLEWYASGYVIKAYI